MITTRGARLVLRLLAFVVLATSGAYLLIYLYRWEWNRAIICGIFFVGAEIVLAASMILVRLRRLDERLTHGAEPPPEVPETRASDDKPFAWLDPTGGGFGVFVPVLMGAGFILSAVAFLVEKLAGALSPSEPVRHDSRAEKGPQPVPARPLVPSPGSLAIAPAPPWPGRRKSLVPTVVAATVAGLLAIAAIDVLADATQDRPDPERAGTTLIDLQIRIREPGPTEAEVAEALWAACRALLPSNMTRIDLSPTAPGRHRLVLNGVIGQHVRRRFVGCLEDATLDRAQGRVVELSTYPAGPRRGPEA